MIFISERSLTWITIWRLRWRSRITRWIVRTLDKIEFSIRLNLQLGFYQTYQKLGFWKNNFQPKIESIKQLKLKELRDREKEHRDYNGSPTLSSLVGHSTPKDMSMKFCWPYWKPSVWYNVHNKYWSLSLEVST